ncbi:MAG TPA: Crp/Fnr family transcriptional regulator [Puia sp.]|nr:Crp/Fnr family transcriptional regulator [Puia sp.]
MNSIHCDQGTCFLCKYSLPEWKDKIAAERKLLHFRRGDHIFREGEKVRGIYFITGGAAKIHRSWGAGNEFILRFARKGDVVGHRGHGSTASFPVSATVLEETTACFIPNKFLETLFRNDIGFLYEMMRLYAGELQKAEKRMHDLALVPVKGRVANALFTIRDTFGTDSEGYVNIPITRTDIACHAGTTYEAVFRLLKEWTRENIVTTLGKQFRIDDEVRLRALMQQDPD